MHKTMKKTYNAPAIQTIEVHMESNLLTDSGTGVSVNVNRDNALSGGSNFSREQKSGGFGSGMWEDMK